MLRPSRLPAALGLGLALAAAGCAGYGFQGSSSPLLDREGIHSIYVAPVSNNTYKPGVENIIYNELTKVISMHRRVKLVSRAEDADAILRGVVNDAGYAPASTTAASQLFPKGTGSGNIIVATSYTAALSCTFSLERKKLPSPAPGTPPALLGKTAAPLWSADFNRAKPFPGNNQLGIYGSTSALINESEFDRALRDLAESMMEDVHESMLAMF